jgi:hypothetical protein
MRRNARCALRRVMCWCAAGVACATLAASLGGALSQPAFAARAAAAQVPAGTWQGTAVGADVDTGHSRSGSGADEVVSTSVSNYAVTFSFSFTVDAAGTISGSGTGQYTQAAWHLYGTNGTNGSFNCNPPLQAAPFTVVVGGSVTGEVASLSLSIPDATETNADYNCGADYTGFATTSHEMADSLTLVGGSDLSVSLAQATSFALSKTVNTGTAPNTEDDTHNWTVSLTPSGAAPATTPVPVFDQTVVMQRVSGTVLVRLPDQTQFTPLGAAAGIPTGSVVNAAAGRLSLTAAEQPGAIGSVPTGVSDFYDGEFKVTQVSKPAPLTKLTLLGAIASAGSGAAKAHSTKKPVRQLWGSGKGNFQMVGSYSSATVRGTTWFVQERTDGTYTFVAKGIVTVYDRVRHRTVVLYTGQHYLARP